MAWPHLTPPFIILQGWNPWLNWLLSGLTSVIPSVIDSKTIPLLLTCIHGSACSTQFWIRNCWCCLYHVRFRIENFREYFCNSVTRCYTVLLPKQVVFFFGDERNSCFWREKSTVNGPRSLRSDHCASKEPANPCLEWIRRLVWCTVIWSEWSRITDPDPDHPKGTHPLNSNTRTFVRGKLIKESSKAVLSSLAFKNIKTWWKSGTAQGVGLGKPPPPTFYSKKKKI